LSSLRRVLASRANGARSRGPKTAAGKQRSSTNAIRHGLLARCVVLENESLKGFQELLADFIRRFQPADGVELGMIEEMISALWRQRRAWAIETSLMDSAVAAQPCETGELVRLASGFTMLAAQPQLELIHRYETRLHRTFQRALNNLLLLRLAADSDPDAEPQSGARPSGSAALPPEETPTAAPQPSASPSGSDALPIELTPPAPFVPFPNKPNPTSEHPTAGISHKSPPPTPIPTGNFHHLPVFEKDV
jgi:hypothetical protein